MSKNQSDEIVDIVATGWYKQMSAEMIPAKYF
jgi:hypothetical protein